MAAGVCCAVVIVALLAAQARRGAALERRAQAQAAAARLEEAKRLLAALDRTRAARTDWGAVGVTFAAAGRAMEEAIMPPFREMGRSLQQIGSALSEVFDRWPKLPPPR